MNKYINKLRFKRSYRKIFNNVKKFVSEESFNIVEDDIHFNIDSNDIIEFTKYVTSEASMYCINIASNGERFLRMKHEYTYAGTVFNKAYMSTLLYTEMIRVLKRCSFKLKDNIICILYDKLICIYSPEEDAISIGMYMKSYDDEDAILAKIVLHYEFNELYNKSIHEYFCKVINGFKFYDGDEVCQSVLSDMKIRYTNFITGDFDNKILCIYSYDHGNVVKIAFSNKDTMVLYKDKLSGVYILLMSDIKGDQYYNNKFGDSDDKEDLLYKYGINQILQFDTDIISMVSDINILRNLSTIYINDHDEIVYN